jgi:hypothetical protein
MPAKRWRSKAAAAVCAHTGAADPQEGIHRLVDALLDAARVESPPADLELLASLRRVRQIDLLEMVEAGRLVPNGTGYLIQVNQRHSDAKRRFTIAHELGHTFFDEAAKSSRHLTDSATGLFDLGSEEEYLCDMAAAHALLNPRWLEPLARTCEPSLDGLIQIAETCQASIEATAIQLSNLGAWRCSFVFWEPGLRKAERVVVSQTKLVGWEGGAGPIEKLRARRVYGSPGVPFLPVNKSVDSGSQVWRAYSEQTSTAGEEQLDLGHGFERAYAESTYAPYFDESGALRPRVISCLLWDKMSDASWAQH